MNSFKNRLDKFWNDSEVMYNSETDIYDITTLHSSRRAHHAVVEEDPDLKPEAQGPITKNYYVWLCTYVYTQGPNLAFSRERQIVSFRFENRLAVPEHRH